MSTDGGGPGVPGGGGGRLGLRTNPGPRTNPGCVGPTQVIASDQPRLLRRGAADGASGPTIRSGQPSSPSWPVAHPGWFSTAGSPPRLVLPGTPPWIRPSEDPRRFNPLVGFSGPPDARDFRGTRLCGGHRRAPGARRAHLRWPGAETSLPSASRATARRLSTRVHRRDPAVAHAPHHPSAHPPARPASRAPPTGYAGLAYEGRGGPHAAPCSTRIK